MGVRTRGQLAARLIARGWSPQTPAAIVLAASHQASTRWIGDLATLGDAAVDTESPGTIVIGEVVELAHRIAVVERADAPIERTL